MNLHKAIRAIYSSAVLIHGDNENNIIAKDINGNEIHIDWTQVNQQLPIVEAEIEQEKQDAVTKKASAKQKLIDLGLTEEEVKALIGVEYGSDKNLKQFSLCNL